jgi:hypothetical protein
MTRFAVRFAVVALFLVPLLAGCSRKVSPVDPSLSAPEGTPDAASRLVVWNDLPWPVEQWQDLGPEGRTPEDVLLGTRPVYLTEAGTVHGLVLDATRATAYQVWRTESNGGVFPLEDHPIYPVRRWLDTGWEMYKFEDPEPSGYAPPTYYGRGIVSGIVTPNTPLSEPARTTSTAPLFDIQLAGNPLNNQGPTKDRYRYPVDSLFVIKWTAPVPNAAAYLVEVFQNGLAVPSPLLLDARDYYVAWVPASAESVKIRREDPGTIVMASRTIIASGQYFVRVAAIDAGGEMIGITYGDTLQVQGEVGFYERVRIGAIELRPDRRTSAQASVGPSAASVAPRRPGRTR